MPNITVPPWLHVTLYLVSVAIVAATHLASSGNIVISAPVAAVLAYVLSVINSVDPETTAKKLPSSTLRRLADQKSVSDTQKPAA